MAAFASYSACPVSVGLSLALGLSSLPHHTLTLSYGETLRAPLMILPIQKEAVNNPKDVPAVV